MTNYKNLDAWKKSMELVKAVYTAVNGYPREEIYGLGSQTKRSAISIPSNIAEGFGRNHAKDKLQFLHIARGSLYELETLLTIASETNILPTASYNGLTELVDESMRILNGLINYIEKSIDKKR